MLLNADGSPMRPGSTEPTKFKNPTDWTVTREDAFKRVSMRYCPSTDEVEVMEEFFEELPLAQAAAQRELMTKGDALRPLAVIPQSVVNRAIREGWNDDEKAWKRWMNDADNKKLRVTDGVA